MDAYNFDNSKRTRIQERVLHDEAKEHSTEDHNSPQIINHVAKSNALTVVNCSRRAGRSLYTAHFHTLQR